MPRLDRQQTRFLGVVRRALLLLSPAILLGGVEAGLRLFGYGYPTAFLVPAEPAGTYTTSESFLRRFYPHRETVRGTPFTLSREKPSNTFRIFILGESAALGTPNPAFGFGRILDVQLRERFPGRRFEIFNAAMRGVNSHIIRQIARECARFHPDLFVVYMGNNEMVGLHGANPAVGVVDRSLGLIRFAHWFKGTKIGQLAQSARGPAPPPKQDMDFFRTHRISADDPRREHVYAHFKSNLQDMLAVIRSAGAEVLLCTVPSNLGDCPPVGSIDEPRCVGSRKTEWEKAYAAGVAALKASQFGEAAGLLEQALQIDSYSANLHYRLGQAYAGAGQFDQARQQYRLARDWDGLALRTDSRLNQIVRDTAERHSGRGVVLIDLEKIFEQTSRPEHGIPGRQLFTDHVHLRFAGDHLVAETLYRVLADRLGGADGQLAESPLSIQECADQLAYNDWEELEIQMAALQQFSRPPFLDALDDAEIKAQLTRDIKRREQRITAADLARYRRVYETAMARRPDDWQLRGNYGVFLMTIGDAAGAVKHLEMPVRFFPRHTVFRIRLADALAHAGRKAEAIEQLRAVLRHDPDSTAAIEGLRVLGIHAR